MPRKASNQEDLRKIIGANITKLRKAHGLRHQDLAVILGLARPSIYNLEDGKHALTIDALMILLQYFKCGIYQIIPEGYKIDMRPIEKRIKQHEAAKQKIKALRAATRKKITGIRKKMA